MTRVTGATSKVTFVCICVFVRSHSKSVKPLILCVALLNYMNRKCIAIVMDTGEWLPPLEGMTLDLLSGLNPDQSSFLRMLVFITITDRLYLNFCRLSEKLRSHVNIRKLEVSADSGQHDSFKIKAVVFFMGNEKWKMDNNLTVYI